MGNRVSEVLDLIPPTSWSYVGGVDNPADIASDGLYPGKSVASYLWWEGLSWLHQNKQQWPSMPELLDTPELSEEKEECQVYWRADCEQQPLLDRFSNYNWLRRVTAWMLHFVHNCSSRAGCRITSANQATNQLLTEEQHWLRRVQQLKFGEEIVTLRKGNPLPRSIKLLPLHSILDNQGVLRVDGRMHYSRLQFDRLHPVLLPGDHELTKLIVRSEHLRLLHASPNLVMASLSHSLSISLDDSTSCIDKA